MRLTILWSIGLVAVLGLVAFGQTDTAPADVTDSRPASAPASAPAESTVLRIDSDDRIVFLGDELIDMPQRQGQRPSTNFAVLTESFLTVRYPDLHPSYFHMGWMGDTATGALARLDRDVLVHKPTIVVICLGMNDSGYQPFEAARLEQFKQEMAELVKRCQAAGAKVWLISPPSSEDDHQRAGNAAILKDGQRQTVNLAEIQYSETLGQYAAAVGEVAQATGSGYIDWYGQIATARTAARSRVPKTFFTYDGRIPIPRSQALAAVELLRAWGAQPITVTIEMDWAQGKALVWTHAATEPVQAQVEVGEGGRRILKLENLPMPWPMASPQDFLRSNWEAAGLCQYILRISDPPAGGVLVEDGGESKQKQVFTTEAAIAGVNLLSTGPLRHAAEVISLSGMISLKNTYRYATWRKLELEGPMEPELAAAHAQLLQAWKAFADGYGEIVRNRSKFIDVILELVEPSAAESQPATRPATRPAQPKIQVVPPAIDDHDADEPLATSPSEEEEEGK
ncbi:MAG: SGNH/GDSL hydrolase family protein [Phycisphaerales bacterium]|nr:SGNH/GDSL hydrolase family protein [Phycisphaerales bacterium]